MELVFLPPYSPQLNIIEGSERGRMMKCTII
ncbi:hypothetical protein K7P76_16940 [Cohnella sp. NL03-T5]|nr:hypothetical protein [Cohnella silvisoli]